MLGRLLKENPDYIVQIKYSPEKMEYRSVISLNGISIFDGEHEKFDVSTGILLNEIRAYYKKSDPPCERGNLSDFLEEQATIVRHRQTPFAEALSNKVFHEIASIANKKRVTFEEMSDAAGQINEFVFQHIKNSNREKEELDKTIDELVSKNEKLSAEISRLSNR